MLIILFTHIVCILATLAKYKSFWSELQLPVVLCVLLQLDYHLNMKIVTNIIYFLTDLCIFKNVLIILY